MPRSLFRSRPALLAVLASILVLPGCVSILPKTAPVPLYRLNQAPPPPATPAPAGLTLARGAVGFPVDVAADRLLTVDGPQAAFIADARWIEPASLMFEQALTDAFDQPGSPRLGSNGEQLAAADTLKLSVRRFYANYEQGAGAPPTVEVTVDAMLLHNGDRAILAEKLFETRQPASDNRIGAIVQAYNAAVAQTLGQIRDWTIANAPPAPAAQAAR